MDARHLILQLPRQAQVVLVLPQGDGEPNQQVEVRTPVLVQLGDDLAEQDANPNPAKVIVTVQYQKN
jgi:hypothetical protein